MQIFKFSMHSLAVVRFWAFVRWLDLVYVVYNRWISTFGVNIHVLLATYKNANMYVLCGCVSMYMLFGKIFNFLRSFILEVFYNKSLFDWNNIIYIKCWKLNIVILRIVYYIQIILLLGREKWYKLPKDLLYTCPVSP